MVLEPALNEMTVYYMNFNTSRYATLRLNKYCLLEILINYKKFIVKEPHLVLSSKSCTFVYYTILYNLWF